jgi:hypothetical protein
MGIACDKVSGLYDVWFIPVRYLIRGIEVFWVKYCGERERKRAMRVEIAETPNAPQSLPQSPAVSARNIDASACVYQAKPFTEVTRHTRPYVCAPSGPSRFRFQRSVPVMFVVTMHRSVEYLWFHKAQVLHWLRLQQWTEQNTRPQLKAHKAHSQWLWI